MVTTNLLTLTHADPSAVFVPPVTGVYHVVIGAATSDFDGASVALSQDGVVFEDLEAVTSAVRKMLHLVDSRPLSLVASSTDTGTSINIRLTLDPEWPRRY